MLYHIVDIFFSRSFFTHTVSSFPGARKDTKHYKYTTCSDRTSLKKREKRSFDVYPFPPWECKRMWVFFFSYSVPFKAAAPLFVLAVCAFVCSGSFFCLQRSFFVCIESFLFTAYLFCLQRVGHRRLLFGVSPYILVRRLVSSAALNGLTRRHYNLQKGLSGIK